MKRLFVVLILSLIMSSLAVVRAEQHPWDANGAKDPPLFNRMPGYYILLADENDFNKYDFPIAKNKTQTVEGHYYHREYAVPAGEKPASALAVIRNYENAVKAIGGKIVWEPSTVETVLKVLKNGAETWAYVWVNGQNYEIFIVQKQSMAQDIVADADSMAQSIKDSGKVALYGIYFDTGKAEIKPESEPALREIAKLMKSDPKLKLFVVGHTDNVGTYETNLKLSKDRADAVVKALTVKYGIPAVRLIAGGVGPLAPAVSNGTDEGRAKNRRVELVAQ